MSLRAIKGVGPQTITKLEYMGIHCLTDLLTHIPRRYEDRSRIDKLKDTKLGNTYACCGTLEKPRLIRFKNGRQVLTADFYDSTGRVKCMWFNSGYLMKTIERSPAAMLYGRYDFFGRNKAFVHPEIELCGSSGAKIIHIGRIVPFYPLAGQMTQKLLRSIVYDALLMCLEDTRDVLGIAVLQRYGLPNLKYALKQIHFPSSVSDAEQAYTRMVFDEFVKVRLAIRLRSRNTDSVSLVSEQGNHESFDVVFSSYQFLMPFKLTASQKEACQHLYEDFLCGRMNRLLQGDVGVGKTAVFGFALYLCMRRRQQAVLVAPTEVLALQHFKTLSKYFAAQGSEIGFLTGGVTGDSRNEILRRIRSGEISVLIGTHAVLSQELSYQDLRLAVYDEQHKFGVKQREVLRRFYPQLMELSVSATPIPRTLALTMFGDIELTELKNESSRKRRVSSLWFEKANRHSAYRVAAGELNKGRQLFIVLPAISRSNEGVFSLSEMPQLMDEMLSGVSYGLIHGRMKKAEANKVFEEFSAGKIQCLISTTVIEVGVDVPNASSIIIESADRFGMSQLHQLRGRVGRSGKRGYCLLINHAETDSAADRMEIFCQTDDGFELAESDLKNRGAGNIIGVQQHGSSMIRIGDPIRDSDLFMKAIDFVKNIEEDPDLDTQALIKLRQEAAALLKLQESKS